MTTADGANGFATASSRSSTARGATTDSPTTKTTAGAGAWATAAPPARSTTSAAAFRFEPVGRGGGDGTAYASRTSRHRFTPMARIMAISTGPPPTSHATGPFRIATDAASASTRARLNRRRPSRNAASPTPMPTAVTVRRDANAA